MRLPRKDTNRNPIFQRLFGKMLVLHMPAGPVMFRVMSVADRQIMVALPSGKESTIMLDQVEQGVKDGLLTIEEDKEFGKLMGELESKFRIA